MSKIHLSIAVKTGKSVTLSSSPPCYQEKPTPDRSVDNDSCTKLQSASQCSLLKSICILSGYHTL